MNNAKSFEAKIIINKSLALGTSPFFLCILLIPLSISKIRTEHNDQFVDWNFYFNILLFHNNIV